MRHIAELMPGGTAFIEPFALYIAMPEETAHIMGAALTTGGEERLDAPFEVRRLPNWDLEVLVPENVKITQHSSGNITGSPVRLVFPEGQIIEKGQRVPDEYIV